MSAATVPAALRRVAASIVAQPVHDDGTLGRFPLMDSLRALAALSIFAYHSLALTHPDSAAAQDLISTLTVGVPVFFAISGFLLYRPFVLSSLGGRPGPRLLPYAWRRVLRLVPGYWLALTVILALRADFSGTGDVLQAYGFAQVYDPGPIVGLPQAWSLDCEIIYYAMLPLVALAVAGPAPTTRRHVLAGVALILLSVVFKVWAQTWGSTDVGGAQSLVFQPGWNLDLFAVGMLVAVWSARHELRGHPDALGRLVARRPALFWLGAAVTFVASALLRDTYGSDAGVAALHALDALFAVLLIAPAVAGPPLAGVLRRRVLANRGLLTIGVLSYGIYLWHVFIVEQVFKVRDRVDLGSGVAVNAAVIVAALVLTLIVSALSWVLVERPALSLKRLAGRPTNSPHVSPGQPATVAVSSER
jgi:peptidoglycan/LPS O-acetylase OafA/YrhL